MASADPSRNIRHSLAQAGLGLGGMAHGGPVIMEGWMLKKRRKVMQGFARRYFTLHESGLLEYGFEPGKPTRDHLYLRDAAISSGAGHKDIHLDATNTTFHCKCLTQEDFEKWMAAFRTFRVGEERALPRRSSTSRTLPRPNNAEVLRKVDEMGTTLADLDEVLAALIQEDKRKSIIEPNGKESHRDQAKHGASKLNIFKKPNRHHDTSPSSSETTLPRNGPEAPVHSTLQRLQTPIDHLKAQHGALAHSLRTMPMLDPSSPTSRIAEEPEEDFLPDRSHRASSASGFSVFYDAPEPEGALEYFMNEETPTASRITAEQSVKEGDEDEDEECTPDVVDDDSSSGTEVQTPPASEGKPLATEKTERQVQRRHHLPSGPVADEGSLFGVLKKNVGKDLSSVALPVTFNEPLTMLQRAAEELEYFDLLSSAAKATDPVERMCLVAAFAMSGYACTKNRSGRKSFNPMLGETFEDSRMKFVAEKVKHQPLVMAFHAEGSGWELNSTSSGKTKFWGKSLEIIPIGVTRVIIGEDCYEWRKPSSFMRNLMMGTKYLEHCGEMVIQNTKDGSRCVLDFQETGYWSPPNLVKGTVHASGGRAATTLEGKWDEQLAQKLDSDHLRVLWRINPFPKNAREYYGFTSFAITLNELTPDLNGRMPPTDSRTRTDVRALEEGDLDRAEQEKLRIEETQRERRRAGKDVQPRWFKEVNSEDWQYVGGYWEQREKGWKGVQPLW